MTFKAIQNVEMCEADIDSYLTIKILFDITRYLHILSMKS